MKDWTKHKFGKLTVINFDHRDIKSNRYYWNCLCECGKISLKEISDLKRGSTKSCGCFRKQHQSQAKIKPPGVSAFNVILKSYKDKCAKERNYDFLLSKDQFYALVKGNCFYCNKPPSRIRKSFCSEFIYNGVDRVDNTKGYTVQNSVSCCTECNSKKSGITKEMVYKLYEYFESIKTT